MKAIILAAGRGSRMGNKTDEIPKGLTLLCEKTLLERQIKAIRKAGINDIGIVRGYMSHKINFDGTKYFDNEKWNETNMLYSLCCADEWLKSDECIVSYSDIVYTEKAVELLLETKEDISITYNTNWLDLWKERFTDPLSDVETFKIDKNNYITEIGHRAESLSEIEGQYMGLLKFTPDGWSKISNYLNSLSQTEFNKMDMTGLLSRVINSGTKIYGVPYDGLWLEVDNQDDLNLYEEKYKDVLGLL